MFLKVNEKISHFKYCTVTFDEPGEFDFKYKGNEYSISLSDPRIDKNIGYLVKRKANDSVDTTLLLWLSLYFGEDSLDPYSEKDDRFTYVRGELIFSNDEFRKFIKRIEKYPFKSHPKWKQKLIENALLYYSCAIRSSVDLMPLNIGFFAMTLECLGNAYYGKRDKYFTLGDKAFKKIINTRLQRYKKNLKHKEKAKEFEKYIEKDIEIVHLIRNAYYGHSLLHLKVDRDKLAQILVGWFIRNGYSKKFSRVSFKSTRIDHDIQREAFGLYKVGLKLARLFLLYFIGYSKDIPFASHDFMVTGKKRDRVVIKIKPRTA